MGLCNSWNMEAKGTSDQGSWGCTRGQSNVRRNSDLLWTGFILEIKPYHGLWQMGGQTNSREKEK